MQNSKIAGLINLTFMTLLQQQVSKFVCDKNRQCNRDLDALHYLFTIYIEICRCYCVMCCSAGGVNVSRYY